MMTFYFQIAVSAVLVMAAVADMRSGRIPNWVALVLVAIFAGFAATTMTMAGALWQVGFAALVFAFGLLVYAITGAGAGAIKLMAAAALFMPIDRGVQLFLLLIATMFCLGLIVGVINRVFRSESSNWAFLKVTCYAVEPAGLRDWTAGDVLALGLNSPVAGDKSLT